MQLDGIPKSLLHALGSGASQDWITLKRSAWRGDLQSAVKSLSGKGARQSGDADNVHRVQVRELSPRRVLIEDGQWMMDD